MDRVTIVTRECYDALIQLRRLDEGSLPPPQALHQRLRSFVEAMLLRAEKAGFGQKEAQDIAYPVVALADELVQSHSQGLRDYWASNSLQLQFFQENVAGEEFFVRLARLRRDPSGKEILRAYYTALLLGFQGRYRVRGGELELLSLAEDLQRELTRGSRLEDEGLSPNGTRPKELLARPGRSRLVLWAALALLALSVAFYAGMRISLALQTSEVIQQLRAAPR